MSISSVGADSFDGGGTTPSIKNEFSIAGGAYSATVIVGTLEKHGYKMTVGNEQKESQVLETIIKQTPKEWQVLKTKVETIVTTCLKKEADGEKLLDDADNLRGDVQLLGFFSGGVKVKIGGQEKSVKCDGFDEEFKQTMEKIGKLAVDAGVATKVTEEEVGLGLTPSVKTPPSSHPLENLTMPDYPSDSPKGGDFTGDGDYTKEDAIAGYLDKFASQNAAFRGVFTEHGSVVDESEDGSLDFKDDFITALNTFIATAHVEESSTEGTAMEKNLIGDFRQAVLERVQAAVVLNPRIDAFIDEFLNGNQNWEEFKDAKLTELSGAEGNPSEDLLAAHLNTLLGAHIVGKIMGLANSEQGINRNELTQAKKILTEEFNQVGHPGLDAELKYTPEDAEDFTVDFENIEHGRGVAWAMTQLGGLKGEREKYFDGDELKVSNLPVPDSEDDEVTYWALDEGKAALAYFEAGLGAKFPEEEE
jgi:hypothetical protein